NDGVSGNSREPVHHAGVEFAQALATGRRNIPRVLVPARVIFRIASSDPGHGHTAPCPEMDFLQTVIGAIDVRSEPHRGANDLHGLTRSKKRARHKIESQLIAGQLGQNAAISLSLSAAVRIDWHVDNTLDAASRVIIGLTVPYEIDQRHAAENQRLQEMVTRAWESFKFVSIRLSSHSTSWLRNTLRSPNARPKPWR